MKARILCVILGCAVIVALWGCTSSDGTVTVERAQLRFEPQPSRPMVLVLFVRNGTPHCVRLFCSTLEGSGGSVQCDQPGVLLKRPPSRQHEPELDKWVEIPAGSVICVAKYVSRPEFLSARSGREGTCKYRGEWWVDLHYGVEGKPYKRSVKVKGDFEIAPENRGGPFPLTAENSKEFPVTWLVWPDEAPSNERNP